MAAKGLAPHVSAAHDRPEEREDPHLLVLARLCEPSSELHIAEDWFRQTALDDVVGIGPEKVNDDRLYRALDRLRPYKAALERHLHRRLGELFDVQVEAVSDRPSGLRVHWRRHGQWTEWAALSEGCYLLRTNIPDWSAEDLWRLYMQLTQAEAAFRIQKSDLRIRPVWHQRADRVEAHILVCFLAYVLWKTLEQWQSRAGLGNSPGHVLDELRRLQSADVVLPTTSGAELRLRCVVRPDKAQSMLLDRLGLSVPHRLRPPRLLAKM